MSVRVRFAPSPTGLLHVGGARTALFNYFFAKKFQGSFILRIEDTDQKRHQEKTIFNLITNLKWLGLDWDEGPLLQSLNGKGPFAPYRQSERLKIYQKMAHQLIKEEKAYYCFMSLEEEKQQKQKAINQFQPFRVSSPYRNLPLKKAKQKLEKGEKACIRFKTPHKDKDYFIEDLLRGKIVFPKDILGDFVLIRRDHFPVYNFSCAVDDSLMEISHVFRGEEHLSNSLKQQLIQKALNLSSPKFAHLSIILDSNKKKLSKRINSASLEYYQKEGYLPSSLMNFLALLGWNPGTEQEFFKKEELIEKFETKQINLAPAVFNIDKLLWLNQEHIKTLSDTELLNKLKPFLKQNDEKQLKKWIPNLRSSFKSLKQSASLIDSFLEDNFSLHDYAKKVLKRPKSKILIEKWQAFLKLKTEKNLSMKDFKIFQKQMQIEENLTGKDFFMPLRCALLGQAEGTEIKLLLQSLERTQLLERVKHSLKQIYES